MQEQVDLVCVEHPNQDVCPDALIHYSERFNEYGLMVHDGGPSSLVIAFCPWCGTKLPSSLRNRWFEELKALGFSNPWSQDVPEQYKSGAWHGGA